MFQRCCIVSVMFKYIFLQFSYVNIQFFVIFQKIGVISLIKISDMKDMLFLHSYDLIKDKQPKNSLKQNLCYIVLSVLIVRELDPQISEIGIKRGAKRHVIFLVGHNV